MLLFSLFLCFLFCCCCRCFFVVVVVGWLAGWFDCFFVWLVVCLFDCLLFVAVVVVVAVVAVAVVAVVVVDAAVVDVVIAITTHHTPPTAQRKTSCSTVWSMCPRTFCKPLKQRRKHELHCTVCIVCVSIFCTPIALSNCNVVML